MKFNTINFVFLLALFALVKVKSQKSEPVKVCTTHTFSEEYVLKNYYSVVYSCTNGSKRKTSKTLPVSSTALPVSSKTLPVPVFSKALPVSSKALTKSTKTLPDFSTGDSVCTGYADKLTTRPVYTVVCSNVIVSSCRIERYRGITTMRYSKKVPCNILSINENKGKVKRCLSEECTENNNFMEKRALSTKTKTLPKGTETINDGFFMTVGLDNKVTCESKYHYTETGYIGGRYCFSGSYVRSEVSRTFTELPPKGYTIPDDTTFTYATTSSKRPPVRITSSTKTTTTTKTTKTLPNISTSCIPDITTITVTDNETVTVKETVTVTVKSNSDNKCAEKWAQCGGQGYNGPTCCQSGSTCREINKYYSQCI